MRSLVLTMVLMLVACGPTGKQPVHTVPQTADAAPPVHAVATGRITIDCTPVDARVNIDGQDHGTSKEVSVKGGLTLPRGLHRIEISLEGHRPFRFELILGEKPETIKVQLQPLPQPPR